MSKDTVVTVAQVVVAKISGSLSVIGSSFVIRNIFKKWRTNRSSEHLPTTARLVLSMSMADLGSSFWAHFISTWMMPPTAYLVIPFAAGNEATCSAQAFLFQFFLSSGGLSNALLAVAYWLVVCREIPERTLRRWYYQLPLLGLSWLFGLTSALLNVIGAGGGSAYQDIWHCDAYASPRVRISNMSLIGLGFLMILCSMASLIRDIYQTENRMRQFQQGGESANLEQTLQVAKQGLSFILVYLVIFIPVLILNTAILAGNTLPKWFYVFYACIFPLQGILNFLVFFRPKFISARKRQGGGGSKMGAILEVLDIAAPSFAASFATFLSSFWRSFRSIFYGTFARPSGATQTEQSGVVDEISAPGDKRRREEGQQ